MFVHGTAVLLNEPQEGCRALEAQVKQQTGIQFRRVSRFILLALGGAHQCLDGRSPDPETAIWVTTENGAIGDTEIVLGQLFRDQSYPKPYNFINTMSNTASFYIAQSLKLESRNITLAATDFAFEQGLQLARCDLRSGVVRHALVGGVDQAVLSEARRRERFGDRLVDGSAWMRLSTEKEGAVGEITGVRSFADRQGALAWLQARPLPDDPVLAFGKRVLPEDQAPWQTIRPRAATFDYIAQSGYFDSVTACGVCRFFQHFRQKTLIHVAQDRQGRFVVLTAVVY